MTRWVVGIDPGFGMTGLVLRKEDSREVVAWATYTLPREDAPDAQVLRSASLAQAIVDCMSEWVTEHEIEHLEVCIEEPIYAHNARMLMLQIRLFEDIEQSVVQIIDSQVDELYLTEVNPMTSKKLLAHDGRADKRAMIAASPFVTLEHPQAVKEALADAYAHSLSGGTRQHDIKAMKMVVVEATARK